MMSRAGVCIGVRLSGMRGVLAATLRSIPLVFGMRNLKFYHGRFLIQESSIVMI
jgi:hypothetical protein